MTDYQRRLDRVLAPDFLEGLDERTTDELRRMRDDCRHEENGISYARRVVQGRLDIVRAEIARRRIDPGNGDSATLLGELPEVLSDDRPAAPAPLERRAAADLVPSNVHFDRRDEDNVAGTPALGDLRTRPADELVKVGEELAQREAELSRVRRELFTRIDTLQEHLVQRYKRGEADVREVLGPTVR